MDIMAVVSIIVSLVMIMDPFASLPMFISVTNGLDEKTVKRYGNLAILVAGILLFVFIFIGQPLMDLFGISMESFGIAGGLVLIMMGIEMIFSLKLSQNHGEKDAPWVIIATPVLTGPGVITAAILFTGEYGFAVTVIASLAALLLTWAMLRSATLITRLMGENAMSIMSRIVGLLIASLGVEYILDGAVNWVSVHQVAAAVALF